MLNQAGGTCSSVGLIVVAVVFVRCSYEVGLDAELAEVVGTHHIEMALTC